MNQVFLKMSGMTKCRYVLCITCTGFNFLVFLHLFYLCSYTNVSMSTSVNSNTEPGSSEGSVHPLCRCFVENIVWIVYYLNLKETAMGQDRSPWWLIKCSCSPVSPPLR